MRNINITRYGIRILPMYLGCLIGLSGCSDAPVQEPGIASEDISVSFRISAGTQGATRAIDETGTPVESKIDPANLKILIFDKEEKLYDVLYDNGTMPENTSLINSHQGEYILQVKLAPERYNINSEFAIVALANWQTGETGSLISDLKGHKIDSSETGRLTLSDLKEMNFVLNAGDESAEVISWVPGEQGLIPMFGSRYTSLRGYDHSIFNEANPMWIPDVKLVRAVTKIEIVNHDTGNGRDITSIELVNRNRKGWLMQDFPFTAATSNVISTTRRGDTMFTTTPLTFHREENTFTAYIPEMEFSDVTRREAIKINLDLNGVAAQKWVYIAPYDSMSMPILQDSYDSDWDTIKRNYIYRFDIASLGFEFIIDVMPWVFGGKVHIELE